MKLKKVCYIKQNDEISSTTGIANRTKPETSLYPEESGEMLPKYLIEAMSKVNDIASEAFCTCPDSELNPTLCSDKGQYELGRFADQVVTLFSDTISSFI